MHPLAQTDLQQLQQSRTYWTDQEYQPNLQDSEVKKIEPQKCRQQPPLAPGIRLERIGHEKVPTTSVTLAIALSTSALGILQSQQELWSMSLDWGSVTFIVKHVHSMQAGRDSVICQALPEKTPVHPHRHKSHCA